MADTLEFKINVNARSGLAGTKEFKDAMRAAAKESSAIWKDTQRATKAVEADQKKFFAQAAKGFKSMGADARSATAGIKGFGAEVKRASNSLGTTSKAFNEFAQSIGRIRVAVGLAKYAIAGLGIAGAVGGIVAMGKGILSVGIEFEKLDARLRAVYKDQNLVNQAMDALRQVAADTPYELGELTDGFIRMASLGMKPTIPMLKQIGDFAAYAGRSLGDTVNAVSDALAGSGFEQLREMGIKKEDIQAMDRNLFDASGKIRNFAKVQEAVFKRMAQLSGGQMQLLAQTVSGRWSTLVDSLKAGAIKIYDSIKGPLGKLIQELTQGIDDFVNSKDFTAFVSALRQTFTKENAESFAKSVIQTANDIKQIVTDIKNAVDYVKSGWKLSGQIGSATAEATAVAVGGLVNPVATSQYLRNRAAGAIKGMMGGPGPLPPAKPTGGFGSEALFLNLRATTGKGAPPVPGGIQPITDTTAAEESARQKAHAKEMKRREAAMLAESDPLKKEIARIRNEYFDKRFADRSSPDTLRDLRKAEALEIKDAYKKAKDNLAAFQAEVKQRQEQRQKDVQEAGKRLYEEDLERQKKAAEVNDQYWENDLERAKQANDLSVVRNSLIDRLVALQLKLSGTQDAEERVKLDTQILDLEGQLRGVNLDLFDIRKKETEANDEAREAALDNIDTQIEGHKDLIGFHEKLFEGIKRSGEAQKKWAEDFLESMKKVGKLNEELLTASLPESGQRGRGILLGAMDALSQGGDPGLVNAAAVAEMRRALGIEPPDFGEVASKWKTFWQDMASNAKGSFKDIGRDLFTELFLGEKDAFKNFGQRLKLMLAQAMSNIAVEGISNVLKGSLGGIFGGGGKKDPQTEGAQQTASLFKNATGQLQTALSGLVGVLSMGKSKLAQALAILAQVIASMRGGGAGGKGGGGLFGFLKGLARGVLAVATGGISEVVIQGAEAVGIKVPVIGGSNPISMPSGGTPPIVGGLSNDTYKATSLGFSRPPTPRLRPMAAEAGAGGGITLTVNQHIGNVHNQADLQNSYDDLGYVVKQSLRGKVR